MIKMIALVVAVVFLIAGCSEKNELVSPPDPLWLSVTSLPHLPPDDGYYQLWATFLDFNKPSKQPRPMHDEGYISLGKFNVSHEGLRLTAPDGGPVLFSIPAGENVQLMDRVAITIQEHHHRDGAMRDDEPGPILMEGRVRGTERTGIADLSIEFGDAVGSDFRGVLGGYTIIAPTSEPDSTSGIWFFQQTSSPSPSLRNLSALNEGWTYEGWVVYQPEGHSPVYYSTGKFLRADSADFDGAGPGQGPGTGLNFPGQDFIGGALSRPNLTQTDYWFMVTVEPFPDNSTRPFSLRILSNEGLTATRTTHTVLPMQNTAIAHAPAAQLVIQR